MKIAIICDLHLPETKSASQYSALEWALKDIDTEKPALTVVAGDITASGDMAPMMHFTEGLKNFHHMLLLGNADMRNENCIEEMTKLVPHSRHIVVDGYEIIGLNTPEARIEDDGRFLLETCKDGAIVFAHHYPDALEQDSREYLKSLLERKKLTYIHGHKHIEMESTIGNSRVIGVRGLDPDKACGVPCVSYFEFADGGFDKYEKCFEMPSDNLSDFWDYLGLSCFSPDVDIDYAIDRGIKNIEIRKYGGPETFDEIVIKAKKWREHGGRYLSVHMPNLRLKEGKIEGIQQWNEAVMLCNALEADGVTVHVPRVSICDMEAGGPVWCEFLEIMTDKISQLPQKTKVGIENIHMPPRMQDVPERNFGSEPILNGIVIYKSFFSHGYLMDMISNCFITHHFVPYASCVAIVEYRIV